MLTAPVLVGVVQATHIVGAAASRATASAVARHKTGHAAPPTKTWYVEISRKGVAVAQLVGAAGRKRIAATDVSLGRVAGNPLPTRWLSNAHMRPVEVTRIVHRTPQVGVEILGQI